MTTDRDVNAELLAHAHGRPPAEPDELLCGGPDRCDDDLCRGEDYGVCGEPSDTVVCLGTGVCGPDCNVHEYGDGADW